MDAAGHSKRVHRVGAAEMMVQILPVQRETASGQQVYHTEYVKQTQFIPQIGIKSGTDVLFKSNYFHLRNTHIHSRMMSIPKILYSVSKPSCPSYSIFQSVLFSSQKSIEQYADKLVTTRRAMENSDASHSQVLEPGRISSAHVDFLFFFLSKAGQADQDGKNNIQTTFKRHSKASDRSGAKSFKPDQQPIKFLCLCTVSRALAIMQLWHSASLAT
eukprot:1151770-Pelagomonas_calceolata.AAC.3